MSDFKAKWPKFNFRWGSAPDPAGEAYSDSPDLLAGFKGPTSKAGEGIGGDGSRLLFFCGSIGPWWLWQWWCIVCYWRSWNLLTSRPSSTILRLELLLLFFEQCLSVCLFVRLSVSLSVCLSVCLSVSYMCDITDVLITCLTRLHCWLSDLTSVPLIHIVVSLMSYQTRQPALIFPTL